ncbi:MAG: DUF3307 domain-containing protein [Flavobacteriaceae bacterium]|nr:DUF3307 domain-containing protein [Flavobacteriaceae bacterium]
MILFLKLLLAHLVGDFLLQPKKWVKEKEKKKLASSKLYLHILVHALILLLILEFEKNYLIGITSIVMSHFLIDVVKLYAQQNKTKSYWFFIDQLLHLSAIFLVTVYYMGTDFYTFPFSTKEILLLAITLLLITNVASIIIKTLIDKWNPENKKEQDDSLAKAGRFIGILERIFVFAFVVTNHWEAIGFLIAAKSVFRFGDLTSSKDRKLTEYILIGTLLSFGFAILTGIVYSQLKQLI